MFAAYGALNEWANNDDGEAVMCLAVPMKIEKISGDGRALVTTGPAELEVDISLIENPCIGDFVIVHAGFAIEKIEAGDAEERIVMFDKMESSTPDG